ncbi:hypothetical protein Taro_039508 [Colocasia esculenta]|uniref:Uncharacterized protein n=1 Tax=Colocasia esculenta TaxID=4460 RepID=A0A843W9I4_COLES|nr:hypothetical protein [Colocasia esculenta]
MRTHISVPLKRRRQGHCRVPEGAFASVAFRRKEGDTASVALPGETGVPVLEEDIVRSDSKCEV